MHIYIYIYKYAYMFIYAYIYMYLFIYMHMSYCILYNTQYMLPKYMAVYSSPQGTSRRTQQKSKLPRASPPSRSTNNDNNIIHISITYVLYICEYIYIYIYTYIYIYIYIHIHLYMCVCIYIYIYIHMCIQ